MGNKMPKHEQQKRLSNKSGMTLIEMSISMAIIAVLSAGLYGMGTGVRRSGERLRIETEARAYAKEAVEEIIAAGKTNLSKPEFSASKPATMVLPRNAKLMRTVSVVWHDKIGAIVAGLDAEGYAEVHVKVRYLSPMGKTMISDSFSTIIN